jgi:hypothetical protein
MARSTIAGRAISSPRYNNKTCRRQTYWRYTVQYSIGYPKINMATLRRVGGALKDCVRGNVVAARSTKHFADIIIDNALFNIVLVTQKSLWRRYGESAALLAGSPVARRKCRHRSTSTKSLAHMIIDNTLSNKVLCTYISMWYMSNVGARLIASDASGNWR